jgi:Ca2+/Na+ antiporter
LWGSGVTRRRWITLSGVVIIALILAFPLQDVIRKTVVVPLAYLWWALGVLYQSIPQVVIWILLIVLIALMLMGSFASDRKRNPPDDPKVKPPPGQVQGLTKNLVKMRRSTYYKWKVANQLGRLARDFLILRGDRASTKDLSPLTGRDWQPSEPIDAYLDTGLHGSFADFPNQPWSFRRPEPTPLDIDVEEVVKFLESQINVNSHKL